MMTERAVIDKRLKFLEADADTSRYLDKFQEILVPSIDDLLDRLYDQILAVPELSDLFPNTETIQAERKAQKEHWLNVLFSKDFGTLHFDSAKRIGATHERVGLTLGWYMDVYCLMLNKFVRLVADHYKDDAVGQTQIIQAINKAVFLDMNFVIDSYLNAKDETMRHLLTKTEMFVAERKEMDEILAREARSLHASLERTRARTESLKKRAESDSKNTESTELTLQQDILATDSDLQQAVNDAAALAQRICDQNEELEQLQDRHKLHYYPSKDNSVFGKIKSFFKPQE